MTYNLSQKEIARWNSPEQARENQKINPDQPFILTLKHSNQPVTGIVYNLWPHNGNLSWETEYLNGLKNGIGISYSQEGTPCQMILWENGKIRQRKLFKDGEWTISNDTDEFSIFPLDCYSQ